MTSSAREHPWRLGRRAWIGIAIVAAGLVSLLLAPAPPRAIVACLTVGVAGGFLYWPNIGILADVSVLCLFAAPYVAHRTVPGWPSYWWQASLIAGVAMATVGSLPEVYSWFRKRS